MRISRVIRQGSSLVVTLPRQLLMAAGINLGDYVFLILKDQDIIIRKVEERDRGVKRSKRRPRRRTEL